MEIDQQQILDELEHVLSSPGFRARKLIKRFLRYAVEETLDGRGDQLNQYSIAVNALGKPEDFSPAYNPVVRIEAGRLRKLLSNYYTNAPQNTALTISMPRGTYQVQFLPRQHQLEYTNLIPEQLKSRITEGPRIFVHFQIPDDHNISSANSTLFRLRGGLLLVLSRFRNIRLVSSASLGPQQVLSRAFLQEIHQVYRADYLLNCDAHLRPDNKDLTLCYTLTHTLTDEIIWTDHINLPIQPEPQDLDGMYRWLVANAISLHSGTVLRHWAEHQPVVSKNLPPAQQTLISYIAFLRDMTLDSFITALNSCRTRLQKYPDDGKALVIFARLCGYDHTLQYGQIPNLEEEWTNAARMAMKLDPGNAEAHSVFAHNSYYRNDYELSRAELEIARQANPHDTACEYLYGLGFCLMGEWERGIAAIQAIMEIPFNQPPWYHILPFLNAFHQQDYATALMYAEQVQDFGYWGDLSRTVTLFRLGRHERAFMKLQKLIEANPQLLHVSATPNQRELSSHPAVAPLLHTAEEMLELLMNRSTKNRD